MATVGDDCYFYYYSSCVKGELCPFRHVEAARENEVTCGNWQAGMCRRPNCHFRHMEIQVDRSQVPCFWENQPTGCVRPYCVFKHFKPKGGMPAPFPKTVSAPAAAAAAKVAVAAATPASAIPKLAPAVMSEVEDAGVVPPSASSGHSSPLVQPVIVNPFEEDSDMDSSGNASISSPRKATHSPVKSSAKPPAKSPSRKPKAPVVERSAVHKSPIRQKPKAVTRPTVVSRKPDVVKLKPGKKSDDSQVAVLSLEEVFRQKALESMKRARAQRALASPEPESPVESDSPEEAEEPEEPEEPEEAEESDSSAEEPEEAAEEPDSPAEEEDPEFDCRRVVVDSDEASKPSSPKPQKPVRISVQERLGKKMSGSYEELLKMKKKLRREIERETELEEQQRPTRKALTSEPERKASTKEHVRKGHSKEHGRKASREHGRKASRERGRKASREHGRKASSRERGRKASREHGRKAFTEEPVRTAFIEELETIEPVKVTIKQEARRLKMKSRLTDPTDQAAVEKKRRKITLVDDAAEKRVSAVKGLSLKDIRRRKALKRESEEEEEEVSPVKRVSSVKGLTLSLDSIRRRKEKKQQHSSEDEEEESPVKKRISNVKGLSLDTIRRRKATKQQQSSEEGEVSDESDTPPAVAPSPKILSLDEIRRRKALKEQQQKPDKSLGSEEEKPPAPVVSLSAVRRPVPAVGQGRQVQPYDDIGIFTDRSVERTSVVESAVLSLEEIRRRKLKRAQDHKGERATDEVKAGGIRALKMKDRAPAVKRTKVEQQIYVPPARKLAVQPVRASPPKEVPVVKSRLKVVPAAKSRLSLTEIAAVKSRLPEAPAVKARLPKENPVVAPVRARLTMKEEAAPTAKSKENDKSVEVKTFSEIMAEKRLKRQQEKQQSSRGPREESGTEDARKAFRIRPVTFEEDEESSSPVRSRTSKAFSDDNASNSPKAVASIRFSNSPTADLSASPPRSRLAFKPLPAKVAPGAVVGEGQRDTGVVRPVVKRADSGSNLSQPQPAVRKFGRTRVKTPENTLTVKPQASVLPSSSVSSVSSSSSPVSLPGRQAGHQPLSSSSSSSASSSASSAATTTTTAQRFSFKPASTSTPCAATAAVSAVRPSLAQHNVTSRAEGFSFKPNPVSVSTVQPSSSQQQVSSAQHNVSSAGGFSFKQQAMSAPVAAALPTAQPSSTKPSVVSSAVPLVTPAASQITTWAPPPLVKRQTSSGAKSQSEGKRRSSGQLSTSRLLSDTGDELLLSDADEVCLDDSEQLDDLLMDIDSLLD